MPADNYDQHQMLLIALTTCNRVKLAPICLCAVYEIVIHILDLSRT